MKRREGEEIVETGRENERKGGKQEGGMVGSRLGI